MMMASAFTSVAILLLLFLCVRASWYAKRVSGLAPKTKAPLSCYRACLLAAGGWAACLAIFLTLVGSFLFRKWIVSPVTLGIMFAILSGMAFNIMAIWSDVVFSCNIPFLRRGEFRPLPIVPRTAKSIIESQIIWIFAYAPLAYILFAFLKFCSWLRN